ncbi:uncharacterized protein LOC134814323 [Bolinopsis microptera]|uniref:uncharacterized protein LOC134814323 n=1 Tax=Bolinopsis microptera TaxID=2820187 RepID=UPI003079C670
MPGSGTTLLDNGSLLIHSGRADGIKRQGVGIFLSKKVRNSLISYTPRSERVLTARLHSKHLNISVVVAYAPIDGADDSEKDLFITFCQTCNMFGELPLHDLKLLLNDFNGNVTSNRYGFEGVIGGESLHSSWSDNGTRRIDFCAANQLVIGGTLFQHRDIHKATDLEEASKNGQQREVWDKIKKISGKGKKKQTMTVRDKDDYGSTDPEGTVEGALFGAS